MGDRQGQTDLSGLRILLTEDNALSAEIMMELLTLRHATVLRASSGEEAVKMIGAAQENFDAVLMDVQMPGMDGYEATRAIRATGFGAKIPVFALTAGGGERERQNAFEAGMNGFLRKPLEMNMLTKALGIAYA